ncbi:MAG: hypothetical protein A4E60_01350 [Syntrophorhabdus sp. PtaB.Bin047]|jgi:hypothetical protein|nr:MAG: hypothetical protein A4E60_01350 [Syntrophorhabdus sp. PtaB.Bin047]
MKKVILGISVVFLSALFSLACLAADPEKTLLDEVTNRTAATLKKIDADLSKTARAVGEGLSPGANMRQALRDLCSGKSYSIDCAFINTKGVMEIIEPEKYRKHEGASIKDHAVVVRIHKTRKPVFSELFTSVEGFQSIAVQYPVFNQKREFAGSVSLLMSPESMVQESLKGLKPGAGAGIVILQPDGTNVYTSDPSQTRLNVLKSTEYKGFHELREMGERIVKEREGTATYRYVKPGSEKVVKKSAVWKTLPFYDNYWRIVITTEKR